MDYQYQAVEQPSNPRKTWPIVLSVVVALTVACGAGVYVYHNKRQEALDTCRQSLAEFSSARKAVLDTSENGSELQKLIRGALGVNDIIDAFADAAPAQRTRSIRKAVRRTPPSRSSISSPKH